MELTRDRQKWSELKGMSKETAMQRYISKISERRGCTCSTVPQASCLAILSFGTTQNPNFDLLRPLDGCLTPAFEIAAHDDARNGVLPENASGIQC